MKRLATTLASAVIILAVSIAPVAASGTTVADQDCWFNLGVVGDPAAPTWVCHLEFGDHGYWAAAFSIGSGKRFEATPNGPAIFFEEIVEIYDSLDFEFVGGALTTFDPGPVIFRGVDRGVVNAASNSYLGNGTVDLAVGPFAGLEGQTYHASGPIEWYPFGAPHRSLGGTFRVH
jgi:hypothetical protein